MNESVRAAFALENPEEGAVRSPGGWAGRVDYVDVDNDGRPEVLIQCPLGAHGSQVAVFVCRGGRLEQLARVSTGTPAGFEFGDFDGDGRIEVRGQETDWSSGLPYATAPRHELLWRWSGSSFAEVSRKNLSPNAATS